MILKKKGVHPNKIADLAFFLGPDDPENDIWLEEVNIPPVEKGRVPVFIQDGTGWNGVQPFCRLTKCHAYYDENGYINFEVVIEIPDEVGIGEMEEGGDPHEVEGSGIPCRVNQGGLLSKLNKLLNE